MFGETRLVDGTDYTKAYSNNINAGTGKVTVTCKGNYKGTPVKTFTINKAAQSISVKAGATSVSVGKTTTLTTTGAKTKVTYTSSNTALATVSSSGVVTAKKVGTVKITVSAAASTNYKAAASKSVTIKIVPAATTKITAVNMATGIKITYARVAGASGYLIYRNNTKVKTITSGSTVTWTDTAANTNGTKYVYKVIATASTGTSKLSKSLTTYRVARPAISSLTNPSANRITVKWGKNAAATGYQIQYSTSSTFASGNKTVTIANSSTVAKTIASLKKGSTYYVRIRTYKTVSSVNYWSAWSAAKSIKITK